MTYGWRAGPLRLSSWTGVAILTGLVAGWGGLALGAGRSGFVGEVVTNDMLRGYFAGAWGGGKLLGPAGQALTIVLPWALDAPELVFEFYLQRPVLVTLTYETFGQLPEARYLLMPEQDVPHEPASAHVRELARGLMGGHRFILLTKE